MCSGDNVNKSSVMPALLDIKIMGNKFTLTRFTAHPVDFVLILHIYILTSYRDDTKMEEEY